MPSAVNALLVAGTLGLLGGCRTAPAWPSEAEVSTAVLGGERRLKGEEQWRGIFEQPVAGAEVVVAHRDWPVDGELTLLWSEDETDLVPSGTTEGRVSEVQLGVRRELELRPWLKPYAGVGVSLFSAEREIAAPAFGVGSVEADWELGAYLHVGVRADVTEHLFCELDLRWMRESEDVNADYDQVAIALGWQW